MEQKVWIGTGKQRTQIFAERRALNATFTQDVRDDREDGSLWSPLESVWTTTTMHISERDFGRISRNAAQGKLYEKIYSFLNLAAARDETDKGSSSQTPHETGNTLRLDFLGNMGCEAAHLLSNAPLCHKAYGFLAEAAIGYSAEDDRCRFPLFWGQTATETRKKLLKGVRGKTQTALKDHPYNKVYLKEQGPWYERFPSIILVPLLPFQDIMDWATDASSAVEYDVAVFTFGADSQGAAAEVLRYAPQECNETEILLAQQLLKTFVRGVSGCVLAKDVKEGFSKRELDGPSLAAWSSLVDMIKSGGKTQINVPDQRRPGVVHVAKGRLTTGISLADPWLMLLKAAINYSVIEGNQLMPACAPEIDEGMLWTTQDEDSAAFWADFIGDVNETNHGELLLQSLASGGRTTELYSSEVD